MKQHIDISQLNELSEKGHNELFIWLLDRGYVNEEPTIGQMIEYLGEGNLLNIRTVSEWHGGGYEVALSRPVKELTESAIEKSIQVHTNKELCDALWQACKEILEK